MHFMVDLIVTGCGSERTSVQDDWVKNVLLILPFSSSSLYNNQEWEPS